MKLRRRRRNSKKTVQFGGLALTQAKLIVRLEAILGAFITPLLLLGFFVVVAWFGWFRLMFPWLHLAALVVFTSALMSALAHAKRNYRRPSLSAAYRRIELANHLLHRPFDALNDKPIEPNSAQQALWQEYLKQQKAKLAKLRAPRWMLDLSARDPFSLRYALLILLAVAGLFGWGDWGNRLIGAINPALVQAWHVNPAVLNAWITPPAYTGLPPIMIASPAGIRDSKIPIAVPEGSILTMRYGEKGHAPKVQIAGQSYPLEADEQGNFALSLPITKGDTIALHRGWESLGFWHINLVVDHAPQIALTEPVGITARQSLKLSYEATDDYGVEHLALEVTPTISAAGIDPAPVNVPILAPVGKQIKQAAFVDLTNLPLAGLPVTIQLLATDGAGHVASSSKMSMTLPERIFHNPLAQALADERKTLLTHDDELTRSEAANMMAGIAHQPSGYHADPVVMLALRTGAVRLILNQDQPSLTQVSNLLWQTAVRIDSGSVGHAEEMLRQAQNDLAAALDRNGSEAEIQQLIDRLQMALGRYLEQLAARGAPPSAADSQMPSGNNANQLTPDDLLRMLQQMRGLSASGARDAARQQLAQLQQIMENLHTAPTELTTAQKHALQQLLVLKTLAKDQQKLLDQTFNTLNQLYLNQADLKSLTAEQRKLQQTLQKLMQQLHDHGTENLSASEQAMDAAADALQQGSGKVALQRQSEALQALRQATQEMAESLAENSFQLPGQKDHSGSQHSGQRDPFGRKAGNQNDDGSVKVPDQIGVERVRAILNELQQRAGDGSRPKDERDYLQRLLERF